MTGETGRGCYINLNLPRTGLVITIKFYRSLIFFSRLFVQNEKRFSSYFYLIFARIKITNRSVIFHFKLSLSLSFRFGHFRFLHRDLGMSIRRYLDSFYIVQTRSLSVFCNLWPNRAAFTINSPMNYCFNSQLNDCINLFLFPNNCAADSRSSVQPKSCFYT